MKPLLYKPGVVSGLKRCPTLYVKGTTSPAERCDLGGVKLEKVHEKFTNFFKFVLIYAKEIATIHDS